MTEILSHLEIFLGLYLFLGGRTYYLLSSPTPLHTLHSPLNVIEAKVRKKHHTLALGISVEKQIPQPSPQEQ